MLNGRCSIASVLAFFLTVSLGLASGAQPPRCIDLAGAWSLQLDPEDQGIAQRWFTKSLAESAELPGSLQSQGFGALPQLDTSWTGTIREEVIQMPRYAPYRDPANFKMPFWLQPKRCYVGPAWYQRSVTIASGWSGQQITLFLERCHWSTQVWVDDKLLGSADSLSVPHQYDVTKQLTPGRHRLTIRVDNRLNINVGPNSHSVTDHTQTNWNGIIGAIELRAGAPVAIADVQVYPDVANHVAYVQVRVSNQTGKPADMQLSVAALQAGRPVAVASGAFYVDGASSQKVVTLQLGDDIKLWSEHEPNLCKLEVSLLDDLASVHVVDHRSITFGMRRIETEGRQFLLNGRPLFFRGTLECCIFPLTGFPPTDVDSWKRIVRRCKEFGLNHIRFHSWCPPEAAFVAADQLGFYYQVECASWANSGASVGDGKPLDQWLYAEADRILEAYGNHPSFVLLAYGNEPRGPGPRRRGEDYLGEWVDHYKQIATRQLVTSAAGWPQITQNQFHDMPRPLRQHGLFNRQAPDTVKDYREAVQKHNVPLISHETGQWCVFPNLDEMCQYTGVLQAKNFEIVQDFLKSHNLLSQARAFLMASGALQTLLYKEEIEVMLRTPQLGGFQLLDLHDFPGQGTALIGVLDPFWEPKPYVTGKQFKRFCGPVVPLARLQSRTWTNDQTLTAEVQVYQFGKADLPGQEVQWTLRTDDGQTVGEGRWQNVDLPCGGLRNVGDIQCALSAVKKACRLKLTVSLPGTPYGNDWDIWVYPRAVSTDPSDDVLVTRALDRQAKARLETGGKVLFLPPPYSVRSDTYGSFEAIFWNRLWFPTQAVHTLGILCDPAHAALRKFPTDTHSNWQWWDLCNRSKPIVMDDLPQSLSPVIQVIDDWNTCRKLALAFEAKVGKGKLMVCSVDLVKDLSSRPVARQLRHSLLTYMASAAFAPSVSIEIASLEKLLREPTVLQRLEATVVADNRQQGYAASNAIDNNPSTIWHTAWGEDASPHPHHLVIDLQSAQSIAGLTYLPRQDMSNGRIAKYAIYVSQDGKAWGEPIATGTWPNVAGLQTIQFDKPASARFVKLVGESEVRGNAFTSIAELDVMLAK